MIELQTKIRRQIEIIGIALDKTRLLRIGDVADLYGCDDLTIKRDLQALRGYGIDIHSEKKRGIHIATPIEGRKMKQIVSQYLGLCNAPTAMDRATSLLVTKQREKALLYVVTLRKCIESSTTVLIDYEKESNDIDRNREISPLMVFSGDGYWRLLAEEKGVKKQFIINKIIRLQPTSKKFKRVSQEEIDELFRHSFKSWIGTEKHQVKLRLDPVWSARIKPRQMMEFEKITQEVDGSVILETTVNSLSEITAWVVSRGKGVEVLEPDQLRAMVIEVARGALENYSD